MVLPCAAMSLAFGKRVTRLKPICKKKHSLVIPAPVFRDIPFLSFWDEKSGVRSFLFSDI